MSLLQDLGARLRDTADDLPLGAVVTATERLRVATDLLAWVRHTSAQPLAVPTLTHAVEHLEHAAHALFVARDQLSAYLTALGLPAEAASAGPGTRGFATATADGAPQRPTGPPVAPLRRWWAARVDELTGYTQEPDRPADRADEPDDRIDGVELFRRVAARAGAGDRGGLRRELRAAAPPLGLGLAALAPTALRSLATELLRHPPTADDLAELTERTEAQVRTLLPQLSPAVPRQLLARVCRVPASAETPADPSHPADSAIAGAVLTGLLLARAGGDASRLDRYLAATEPAADEPRGGTGPRGPRGGTGPRGPRGDTAARGPRGVTRARGPRDG